MIKMKHDYDVAIIGSGPAGLWAADELASKAPELRIAIFEKNKYSSGGMLNDCKLNLSHKIGVDLDELGISEDYAHELIKLVDDKFLYYGANAELSGTDHEEINKWVKKAEKCGVELVACRQRHIGTDQAVQIAKRFKQDLESKLVQFYMQTEVKDIKQQKHGFKVITDSDYFKAKHIICAPGRDGAYWLRDLADKLKIRYRWSAVDIGVRLEVLAK